MRIAQISPLHESVPPKLYGGTERVVSYLTEALVRRGHQVTLFASGDSVTAAELRAICPQALRLDENCRDGLPHHLLLLKEVMRARAEFDIIHFHTDYLHFPLSPWIRTPHVTTLHGRLDLPDLVPLYHEFPLVPLVSISDSQRKPLAFANWRATIHHGLPLDLYRFHEGPGQYLAFLGRISPEKRPDRAIEIAMRAGLPLKLAAKVDKVDAEYFDNRIAPLLESPLVEFLGEIGEWEKDEFLGNAKALLFPIDWPEPFGLVMVEALACGTPVIAYPSGAVTEVLEDGVTGFVVDSIEKAGEAIERLSTLCRRTCRRHFERRFSADRMARDYEDIYATIAAKAPVPAGCGPEEDPEFERSYSNQRSILRPIEFLSGRRTPTGPQAG